jgi:Mn-dependent DtxR family transcriptional regulator
MFLMHEAQLGADHVDRDADVIEHHLAPDTVAELERLLRLHGREMELPASVHPVKG